MHPRAGDGSETLAPQAVAQWVNAIRAAVPGVPVGFGTGAWIAPGGWARHVSMAAWNVGPDYVSVNLGEEDGPDVVELMRSKGIGIEAGIWSIEDARRFLTLPDRSVLRLLVEMPDGNPELAKEEALEICDILTGSGPILLHGEGATAWPMLRLAARMNHDMRIGLEDVTHLPDGRPATGNAALVKAAMQIISGSAS